MNIPELKLKQASVVADVPPKELQNLVQFKVIRPKRRGRAYWFDRDTLLQAKCAFYLKETLGASTEYLAGFVRALAGRRDLTKERASVRIESSPRPGLPPVGIIVPVGMLRRALEARIPLAAVAKDVPPGRRRPGWKQEFLRSLRDAAQEMPELSEEQILSVVRQHRRTRGRPEIAVAAKG
ncbi:MAG: hypothetical protein GEU99_10740 [Luteitalea sp.]|nr:hypothetical protein [Luteitalea sp.]